MAEASSLLIISSSLYDWGARVCATTGHRQILVVVTFSRRRCCRVLPFINESGGRRVPFRPELVFFPPLLFLVVAQRESNLARLSIDPLSIRLNLCKIKLVQQKRKKPDRQTWLSLLRHFRRRRRKTLSIAKGGSRKGD